MLVSVLIAVLSAAPSGAAAPAAAPSQEAGKLFDKARAAFKAGNFAEACPAFEQSYTLEPALGTLLNLGSCLEKQGRFASASLRYNDAVGWSLRTHEADREQYARKLSNDVKPKVSWLAISSSEDLDLKVDTLTVRVTPTPISLPVDPGLHSLVTDKPGYEKWSANVEIVQPGTTSVQKVPQLKPLSLSAAVPPPPPTPKPEEWSPPPPPPADPVAVAPPAVVAATPPAGTLKKSVAPSTPGSTRGAGIALVVGGSLVAVAGAVGLGWSASTYGALQNQRINVLPPSSYVTKEDYERLKWAYPASYAALGVGAAAIVGGVILAVKKQPVTVAPSVGPGGAGVTLSGQFE